MDKPEKLSSSEAERKIHFILEQGRVEFSGHCIRDRMLERNVTTLDVVNVLEHGKILREPEWDDKYQSWKYRVEGVDLEGDELTAITVIFEDELSLLVVTVF